MSVALQGGQVHLSGPCRVEDAEALLVLLQADRTRPVDIAAATHLHAAVLQVLLAFQPAVTGRPADPFLDAWLSPILRPETAP